MATSPIYGGLGMVGGAAPPAPWWAGVGSGLARNSNLLLGLGAGLLSGNLAEVPQGIATGAQTDRALFKDYTAEAKQKADDALTANYIKATRPDLVGLPPAQAFQVAMKDQAQTAADPSDVATYKFYANQELQAGRKPKPFAEWFPGTKQGVKSGLGQPIYGKNRKTGEYMPFEPMSDGSIASLTDPNANPADFIFDPGGVASDKAAGAGYGALQGPAQFNLPKAQQDVETELGNINALLQNNTGLDQSFGNLGGFNIGGVGFPNQWTPTLPNTPKAGFQAQLSQVAGENFLNAYSTLRGAGAITETEGQSAKEAMARLSTAQSKADFLKALDDLKKILAVGYQRMATQTTMGPYQSSGYQPPALGTGPAAAAGAGGDLKQKYGLE